MPWPDSRFNYKTTPLHGGGFQNGSALIGAFFFSRGDKALTLAGVLAFAGIRSGLAFGLPFAGIDAAAMHFCLLRSAFLCCHDRTVHEQCRHGSS